jgi:hypothetical protein
VALDVAWSLVLIAVIAVRPNVDAGWPTLLPIGVALLGAIAALVGRPALWSRLACGLLLVAALSSLSVMTLPYLVAAVAFAVAGEDSKDALEN